MYIQYFLQDGEFRLRSSDNRVLILHRDYFDAQNFPRKLETGLYGLPSDLPFLSIPGKIFNQLYKNIQEYTSILLEQTSNPHTPPTQIHRFSKLKKPRIYIMKAERDLFKILQTQDLQNSG